MRHLYTETVNRVHHWNDHLFSFRTSRDPGFRFRSGEFTMIGLEINGEPLMRAYSMASASWEEHLEFFSIKVPDGPLTSHLQHLKVGDKLLINSKPTGTLVLDRLLPGKRLYLIATGTGLAPFLSLIQDPETWEMYEQVIVTHGVRRVSALTYEALITKELKEHEFLGELVGDKLFYYPTVTREPYPVQGRLTDHLANGDLFRRLQLPEANPDDDRFMICGSMGLNKDMIALLTARGFEESKRGEQRHFTVERAFVG